MNVMTKAHMIVKDAIKAQVELGNGRTHTYAQMLSLALKQAHKDFKTMRNEAQGVITLISKNTHELKAGDVVLNYGVAFELLERKTYPMRADDCPDRQGDCIVFTTKCVGSTVSGDVFPMGWRKGYTIQGNKMATWAVIEAK